MKISVNPKKKYAIINFRRLSKAVLVFSPDIKADRRLIIKKITNHIQYFDFNP